MFRFIVTSIQPMPEGVFLLTLENKSGRYFRFVPGQYAALQTRRHGRPSASRCFSIVSSPSDQYVQFAFRVTGDYSYRLSRLQPGEPVYVQGPYGSFCIDERYDKNVVLLAAGIGITPSLSMLRWLADSQSPIKVTLVYSCRRLQTAPFINELQKLAQRNPHMRVIVTCDSPSTQQPANISVVTGRLDAALLGRLQPPTDATYFVCGPPAYMNTTSALLKKQGINDDRILIESFGQRKVGVPGLYQVGLVRWYTATAMSIALLASLFVIHNSMEQAEQTTTTAKSTQTTTQKTDDSNTSTTPTAATQTTTTSTPSTTASTPTTNTSNNTPTYTYTYQQPTSSMS